jgi:ArsR family transcriptional regulator
MGAARGEKRPQQDSGAALAIAATPLPKPLIANFWMLRRAQNDELRSAACFAGLYLTNQIVLMYNGFMATLSAPAVSTRLDLARAARLFHALSDETRLGVLEMLRGGERCVCELQDELDAAQSRLSFHLKVLREAGLVRDRKEGRWSYYSLVPGTLGTAHDVVRTLATEKTDRRSRNGLKVLGDCCR